jgi:hypothetical protein
MLLVEQWQRPLEHRECPCANELDRVVGGGLVVIGPADR